MASDPQDIEIDLSEYKYQRFGHINQGRLCDRLVEAAAFLQKGDLMPPRWRMGPPAKVISEHGAGSKWSKTQSYHLFLHEGMPLFRIWTNTNADYAWVDVNDSIANRLSMYVQIEDIPSGNLRKCKPHTKRFKATDTDAIILLITVARDIYGLEGR